MCFQPQFLCLQLLDYLCASERVTRCPHEVPWLWAPVHLCQTHSNPLPSDDFLRCGKVPRTPPSIHTVMLSR